LAFVRDTEDAEEKVISVESGDGDSPEASRAFGQISNPWNRTLFYVKATEVKRLRRAGIVEFQIFSRRGQQKQGERAIDLMIVFDLQQII
jgi:hypothetical protein